MAIDGYFLTGQIKEFNKSFINGKLRKVNGETLNSLTFEFFVAGQRKTLLFDVSPNQAHMRETLNSFSKENFNFLNVLKKELLNSTLEDISQYKKDRVVLFTFIKNDPFLGKVKKTLIFEVMGRNSNLVLVDENYFILDAMKKMFNEDKRSILPNIKYDFFPSEKEVFTFDMLKTINSPDDLFYNYMGFSKEFASFIYNNKLDPNSLDLKPVIYLDKRISFHCYDIDLKGEKLYFNNTSTLLEYYYDLTAKSDDFLIKLLKKQQQQLRQKINNLNTELLKNKDYETYKDIADMIYMSGLDLKTHQQEFNNYELDIKLSLNDNAQKLYKTYKRLKNSIDFLNKNIKTTTLKLNYFDDLIANYSIFSKDDLIDLKIELTELGLIKEKKQKEKPKNKYLIFNLDNATCYVGKTNKQNEEIFKNFAKGEDYWFHVKDYPGSHVILKGDKTEQNIEFAATKALLHSSLKNALKGFVDYTKVKYVKKVTSREGFYVTHKNSKTIFVTL